MLQLHFPFWNLNELQTGSSFSAAILSTTELRSWLIQRPYWRPEGRARRWTAWWSGPGPTASAQPSRRWCSVHRRRCQTRRSAGCTRPGRTGPWGRRSARQRGRWTRSSGPAGTTRRERLKCTRLWSKCWQSKYTPGLKSLRDNVSSKKLKHLFSVRLSKSPKSSEGIICPLLTRYMEVCSSIGLLKFWTLTKLDHCHNQILLLFAAVFGIVVFAEPVLVQLQLWLHIWLKNTLRQRRVFDLMTAHGARRTTR